MMSILSVLQSAFFLTWESTAAPVSPGVTDVEVMRGNPGFYESGTDGGLSRLSCLL